MSKIDATKNALQIICPSCKVPMEFIRDNAGSLFAVCECGFNIAVYEPNFGYVEIKHENEEKSNHE